LNLGAAGRVTLKISMFDAPGLSHLNDKGNAYSAEGRIMKVGILGSGTVAQTLAAGLMRHGHDVMLGTRDASKLVEWQHHNPAVMLGGVTDATAFGEVLVLAVKGLAAFEVLNAAGNEHLQGKTVIDATNPIADAAPTNGVLRFFTGPNESLMEQLQNKFSSADFVKAFNSVGSQQFVHPHFSDGRPTMFICGNSDKAKVTVVQILNQFGWDTADMGKAEAARAIEPLCMLWCILGFTRNEWTHAFKLLRSE
jgi:predicted dinucleotide-binding enzyme